MSAPDDEVQVQPGDVVLARGSTLPSAPFYAQVTGTRLGRLTIERCDGRLSGPLSLRDVVCVYKAVGAPTAGSVEPSGRRKPTAQLKLEL
jgi:hypothetical protein